MGEILILFESVYRNLRTLREKTVTYGGKYIHIADLKSLINCLVEYDSVVQCRKYDATTN